MFYICYKDIKTNEINPAAFLRFRSEVCDLDHKSLHHIFFLRLSRIFSACCDDDESFTSSTFTVASACFLPFIFSLGDLRLRFLATETRAIWRATLRGRRVYCPRCDWIFKNRTLNRPLRMANEPAALCLVLGVSFNLNTMVVSKISKNTRIIANYSVSTLWHPATGQNLKKKTKNTPLRPTIHCRNQLIAKSVFSHKYMVRVYRTLQHALHPLRLPARHLMLAPDESAPGKRSATLG